MRNAIYLLHFLAIIAMMAIIGCSSGKVTPVEPASPDSTIQEASANGNHELVGIWTAKFDLESLTATVEPNREVLAHYNVKPYLPAPTITVLEWDPSRQLITVDVRVNNNTSLTAYDFRLIIFSDAVGHVLMKPDNWTAFYDIAGGDTINPFRAFCKSITNRAFAGQTKQSEELIIKLPGGNPYVYFAMDASYPGNCVEPYSIVSFTQEKLYSTAGSSAAIGVDIFHWNEFSTVTASLFCSPVLDTDSISFSYDTGNHYIGTLTNIAGAPAGQYSGLIRAQTNLSPRTGLYKYVTITVSPVPDGWVRQISDWGPMVETVSSDLILVTANREYYEFNNKGDQLLTHSLSGDADWGEVNDMYYDATSDYVYFCGAGGECNTTSGYYPSGMLSAQYDLSQAQKWTNLNCSIGYERPYDTSVALDPYGFSYCAGYGYGLQTTIAGIMKSDQDGVASWTHTFNGYININDMEFQGTSALMGTGSFWGSFASSFDAWGDTNWDRTPAGYQDGFLAGWMTDGHIGYLATWGDSAGGSAMVYSRSITLDSSFDTKMYVIGDWNGQVDFDPTSGVNNITSTNGTSDIYVSKFNASGGYFGTMAITCTGNLACGRAITTDQQNNILITGYFSGDADFDPTSGQYLVPSAGLTDAFVAKYNDHLELIWVRTFGSTGNDEGLDIASNTLSDVYVTGLFEETVDFDPGPDVVTLTDSGGNSGGFLFKLLSNGTWYK